MKCVALISERRQDKEYLDSLQVFLERTAIGFVVVLIALCSWVSIFCALRQQCVLLPISARVSPNHD
jgi:hypothetical protein